MMAISHEDARKATVWRLRAEQAAAEVARQQAEAKRLEQEANLFDRIAQQAVPGMVEVGRLLGVEVDPRDRTGRRFVEDVLSRVRSRVVTTDTTTPAPTPIEVVTSGVDDDQVVAPVIDDHLVDDDQSWSVVGDDDQVMDQSPAPEPTGDVAPRPARVAAMGEGFARMYHQ